MQKAFNFQCASLDNNVAKAVNIPFVVAINKIPINDVFQDYSKSIDQWAMCKG